MALFICVVPVASVRADASHRSEQVTQLLFGESCEVLERLTDFLKIRIVYDGYEGWCQATQLQEVDEPISSAKLAGGWVNEIEVNGRMMRVPFGASLPDNNTIANYTVKFEGVRLDVEKNILTEELLRLISHTFLNTAYLWGGRSVFGIDCSGFSQLVFKCLNIHLLRDASQQATQGDEVGFLQQARVGDLAFFDSEAGRITHVGILLDTETIIHAAGKVRIDKIDNAGIMNVETSSRTHKLRLIKRMSTFKPKSMLF